MSKNVVITGIGLITEKRIEQDNIWNSLFEEQCVGTIEKDCDIICNNDFKKRFVDITSCSTYGYCAVELAWKNAFKASEEIDRTRWGVYNGTAFGSFTNTVHNVCRDYIKNGPGGLLPGIFNNKSCNVTADIISISHNLMGANNTFMSGRVASGMAIMQAFDDIENSELQGIVVIGTEAIDPYIIEGLRILGEENTASLVSGAGSVIMQALEDIDIEKIKPRGYIRAVEVAGCRGKKGYYNDELSSGLIKAINNALDYAGVDAESIDLIISGQGKSVIEASNYEKAYNEVFGSEYGSLVLNTKNVFGDSLGAFPAMNTALGVMLLEKQKVFIQNSHMDKDLKYVLVTADDPEEGNAWALVLERYDGTF